MIIRETRRLAFAAVCLTMIATLSLARAQMSGIAPGSYWASAGPYWPPPYGLPPAAYGPAPSRYGPPPGGIHVITNGPRTNPGDVSRSWSAQRNVVESEHYERLLKENPAFRQARIRKERGPIRDRQLHRLCLDSFARY